MMWFGFGFALLVVFVLIVRREWQLQTADRRFMERLQEFAPLTITISADMTRFAEAMKRVAEAMPTPEQLAENIRRAFERQMVYTRLLLGEPWGEPEIPIDHTKCWRCQETPVPREDDLGLCTHCTGYLQRL